MWEIDLINYKLTIKEALIKVKRTAILYLILSILKHYHLPLKIPLQVHIQFLAK